MRSNTCSLGHKELAKAVSGASREASRTSPEYGCRVLRVVSVSLGDALEAQGEVSETTSRIPHLGDRPISKCRVASKPVDVIPVKHTAPTGGHFPKEFCMQHSITAEFSLNTPLFSSGADHTKPELRVSEIKAALRFWWRAMNYGLVTGEAGSIAKLAERESKLFGSTKGQSPFLLRLSENQIDTCQSKSAIELVKEDASRYLGYGLTETGANRFGKAVGSGPKFSIQLILKDQSWPEKQEYVDTLKLFGLFGGLGYRSRRGFGSVTLQKLWIDGEDRPLPNAADAYGLLFNEEGLLSGCPAVTKAPEYSSFVKTTGFCRVVLINHPTTPFTTGMNALDAVAKKFRELLTSPVQGQARRQKGREVRTDDASWAYMGLPRKYAFNSPEHNPGVIDKKSSLKELERRASPLFFHVYQAAMGDYRVVAILFKSRFLPDGYGVHAANSATTEPLPSPPANGYAWIDEWLISPSIGKAIESTAGTT